MELIIYLVVAFAAFAAILTFVVGLVSAPTPILVTILILGLMLTQKSINKLNESEVNLGENRDKEKIESVEVAANVPETGIKTEQIEPSKAMTYRGYTYKKKQKLDKNQSTHPQIKTEIKYRGASLSPDHKRVS
jgi:hypothetical protein